MRRIQVPEPIRERIREVVKGENIGLLTEDQLFRLLEMGARIAVAYTGTGVRVTTRTQVEPLYKWMEE